MCLIQSVSDRARRERLRDECPKAFEGMSDEEFLRLTDAEAERLAEDARLREQIGEKGLRV
jgi:hypothetical protein